MNKNHIFHALNFFPAQNRLRITLQIKYETIHYFTRNL